METKPTAYICEPCGEQMTVSYDFGKGKRWITCEECNYRVSGGAFAEFGRLEDTELLTLATCPSWVKGFLNGDSEAAKYVTEQLGHMEITEVVINPEERINFSELEKIHEALERQPRVAIEPKNFKGNRNERRRNKRK